MNDTIPSINIALSGHSIILTTDLEIGPDGYDALSPLFSVRRSQYQWDETGYSYVLKPSEQLPFQPDQRESVLMLAKILKEKFGIGAASLKCTHTDPELKNNIETALNTQTKQAKTTIIVGTGNAGIISGIQILRQTVAPVDIHFLEANSKQVVGGMPWGDDTINSVTTHAMRMSIIADDPDDFTKWLHTAKRQGWKEPYTHLNWPDEYVNKALGAYDHVKGPLFRTYLQWWFERTKYFAEKTGLSNIRLTLDQVENVFPDGRVETKENGILQGDAVILATGHPPNKRIAVATPEIAEHNRYIGDGYLKQCPFSQVKKDDHVVVLGSTAGMNILSHLRGIGYTGKITFIDRTITALAVDEKPYRPGIIDFDQLFDTLGKPRNFDELCDWISCAFILYEQQGYSRKQVLWGLQERLLDVLEHFTQDEIIDLYNRYVYLINSIAVTRPCNVYEAVAKDGNAEILVGALSKITADGDERLLLNFETLSGERKALFKKVTQGICHEDQESRSQIIQADWLFVTGGRSYNYSPEKIQDPLWQRLGRTGTIVPHRSNMGVEVNRNLQIIDRNGNSGKLYTLGVTTMGYNLAGITADNYEKTEEDRANKSGYFPFFTQMTCSISRQAELLTTGLLKMMHNNGGHKPAPNHDSLLSQDDPAIGEIIQRAKALNIACDPDRACHHLGTITLQDGREVPAHVVHAADNVITDYKYVAAIRRGMPPAVGRLALPGGLIDFMENGATETTISAGAREALSEIGIHNLGQGTPIGRRNFDRPFDVRIAYNNDLLESHGIAEGDAFLVSTQAVLYVVPDLQDRLLVAGEDALPGSATLIELETLDRNTLVADHAEIVRTAIQSSTENLPATTAPAPGSRKRAQPPVPAASGNNFFQSVPGPNLA